MNNIKHRDKSRYTKIYTNEMIWAMDADFVDMKEKSMLRQFLMRCSSVIKRIKFLPAKIRLLRR